MKEKIKIVGNSMVLFIACNLAAFLLGFIVAFIYYVIIRYNPAALDTNSSSWVVSACMSGSFVIPFYFLYFLKNKKYKKLYLDKSYEGVEIREIMRMHIKRFAKYELPVIFIISIILSFVPTLILGKSGITFLFSSSTFFTGFMTEFFFTKDIFINRLIAYITWDIYITASYFGCLRLAYRHWNKTRLKKPRG